MLNDSQFWVSLLQIIGINIVLSGDNAVVIALASRSLPAQQQKKAILLGSVAAILLRIALTFFAVALLALPYLKIIGSVLLLYIGVKLLIPEEEGAKIKSSEHLFAAVRTILVADVIMSLDNVIGVAAAAKGNTFLLVLGLVISIPLIIYGSTLILKLMGRFPVIITLGAALLGYVAGEMVLSDPALAQWFSADGHYLHNVIPAVAAIFVVVVGKWLGSKTATKPDSLE